MKNKNELNKLKKHLDEYMLLDPSKMLSSNNLENGASFEILNDTKVIVDEEQKFEEGKYESMV